MAVDIKELEVALVEVERFKARAETALKLIKADRRCHGKKTAAVRRSSMDLTRSLAELRSLSCVEDKDGKLCQKQK